MEVSPFFPLLLALGLIMMKEKKINLFCFSNIFDSAALNTGKTTRRKSTICAFLTQFYAVNILIGSLSVPVSLLWIKPLHCGEGSKSEVRIDFFFLLFSVRKNEKTTPPNYLVLEIECFISHHLTLHIQDSPREVTSAASQIHYLDYNCFTGLDLVT